MKPLLSLGSFFCLFTSISLAWTGDAADTAGRLAALEATPIVFERLPPLSGSADRIAGRVPGATVGFSAQALDISLASGQQSLRIQFQGAATSARVDGINRLPSETNYLIGSDPSKWRTHVANYARVAYTGLYRGIDGVCTATLSNWSMTLS